MLVAVLVSYIPVLGGPFVWDDQLLIEQSVLVRELRPLSEYLGRGFWQADDLQVSRKYYRPLSILSLALDEKIYAVAFIAWLVHLRRKPELPSLAALALTATALLLVLHLIPPAPHRQLGRVANDQT